MRRIDKLGGGFILLVVLGGLFAGCQSTTVRSPTIVFPDKSMPEWVPETPAHQKTENLLEAAGDFVADKQPLETVIKSIARQAGVNIVVQWSSLEIGEVKRTTPVSVKLRKLPLGRLLTVVLGEVGGGAVNVCYYIEDDGTVTVATKDYFDTEKYQFVRAFDIGFLLDVIDPADTTDFRLPDVIADRGNYVPPPYDVEAAIQRIITGSVAPSSWRNAGGTVGWLQIEKGLMVVNQTKGNLNQIAVVLAKLRKIAESHFQVYDVRDIVGTDDGKLRQLMELVEGLSPQRIWVERGGRMGSMRGMAGFIYVNGAKHVQDEVAAELRVIRQTNPGLRPMKMVTPTPAPYPPDTMPAPGPGSLG